MYAIRSYYAVIFTMTILASYVMGKRRGFGFEAAFFVSLMPTTIGILGPAFLVQTRQLVDREDQHPAAGGDCGNAVGIDIWYGKWCHRQITVG